MLAHENLSPMKIFVFTLQRNHSPDRHWMWASLSCEDTDGNLLQSNMRASVPSHNTQEDQTACESGARAASGKLHYT